MIITVCPFATAVLSGFLILLKDEEYYSIILTTILVYVIQLLMAVVMLFVFLFLRERRKFLVWNKLEYLKKKYSKLKREDSQGFEERRRPRGGENHFNFDEEKYQEEYPANRSMMKTFD